MNAIKIVRNQIQTSTPYHIQDSTPAISSNRIRCQGPNLAKIQMAENPYDFTKLVIRAAKPQMQPETAYEKTTHATKNQSKLSIMTNDSDAQSDSDSMIGSDQETQSREE